MFSLYDHASRRDSLRHPHATQRGVPFQLLPDWPVAKLYDAASKPKVDEKDMHFDIQTAKSHNNTRKTFICYLLDSIAT